MIRIYGYRIGADIAIVAVTDKVRLYRAYDGKLLKPADPDALNEGEVTFDDILHKYIKRAKPLTGSALLEAMQAAVGRAIFDGRDRHG